MEKLKEIQKPMEKLMPKVIPKAIRMLRVKRKRKVILTEIQTLMEK